MLSNITFGRFFPGSSPIHKVDPRVKISLMIALLVLVFLSRNYLAVFINFAAIFTLMTLTKIPLKTYFKSMKYILFVVVFTSLMNVFYAQGEPLFQVGALVVTRDGLNNSIFVALRLVMLLLTSSLLTFTTSPTDLTDALERLMKPLALLGVKTHELAMMMTIALRFIPTLLEETDKIVDAQKARGADMENGNLIKRVKAMVPILVPLFMSSFRRAYDLAVAMECRCYKGGEGRTRMKVLHLQSRDFLAMLVVAAVFALVLLSNACLPAVSL